MRKGASRLLGALFASLIFAVSLRPAVAGVNQWTPVGPDGGLVLSVAAHPDQAGLVFAGTVRSLYRSTNNGQTWSAIRHDIPNGIKRILVDPSNTSRVFALAGNAVYRSDDFGVSFGASGTPVAPLAYLTSMAIASDGSLYVGVTPSRVFRASSLNPLQWEDLSAGLPSDAGVTSLTVDPQDENFLYAITGDGRVYKTANGGGSWSQLTSFPNVSGRNIAVEPGSSSDLLAATGIGLWTSPDGGASWTQVQHGRFDWVGYHPAGSGAAVALSGDGAALRRTARAAAWTTGQTLKLPYLPDAAYDPKNPDVSNSTLWVATSDGAQLTQDSAATFQVRSQGIIASSVRQLATAQGTIYALFATGPSGLHRRTSLASGWEAADNAELRTSVERPFEPLALAADAQQPNSLFAASGASVVYSPDGGASWTQPAPQFASPNNIFPRSLAIDPSDPQVVYAGTDGGFYRSTNAGGTWFQPTTTGVPPSIGAMVVDPGALGTVYVAPLSDPGVYKTTDGGLTWAAASSGLAGTVLSLTVDPSDPQTIYATSIGTHDVAEAGLYRTVNGGQTWAKVPGAAAATSQSASDMDVDPVLPTNLVLSASSLGVPIRSVDAGVTWEPLNFPSADDRFITRQILFDPLRPHVVLAGTEHFGLMEFQIAPDLRVAITSSPVAVPLGASAPATVRVDSSAVQLSASDVELTLTMPTGVTAEVPSPSQGTCSARACRDVLARHHSSRAARRYLVTDPRRRNTATGDLARIRHGA